MAMPVVVGSKPVWCRFVPKDDPDAKPRFLWQGVRVWLDDGTMVFWYKTGAITVQLPDTEVLYKSGTPSGCYKSGDRCTQSTDAFLDSHSLKFCGMVLGEVQRVLGEMKRC